MYKVVCLLFGDFKNDAFHFGIIEKEEQAQNAHSIQEVKEWS